MVDNNKDYINDDNMLMVEAAKRKLHWYTMEASDEEFDEEDVDMLVNIINKYSPEYPTGQQEKEEELERFREYCDLYKADGDKADGKSSGIRRKRRHFIGVAACIAVLIVTGISFGAVNAGEDGGFFNWLEKDKDGTFAVTAPEVGLTADVKSSDEYDRLEEVPEEYVQYLPIPEEISSLQNYRIEQVKVCSTDIAGTIYVELCSDSDNSPIIMGAKVYEDTVVITREKFDNYEFMYTNDLGELQQDVFLKSDREGEEEYFVCFYKDNVKYYVSGKVELSFLELLAKEYSEWNSAK